MDLLRSAGAARVA